MLGANAKHGTTCCHARRQDAPIAGYRLSVGLELLESGERHLGVARWQGFD